MRQYSDRRSDPKKVGECCVAQESSQKAPFLPSTPIKGDSTWRNNTTDYQPSTPQSQTLKPRLLLLILQGKGRQTEPQPAPPYTKPKTLQVTHYYSSLRLLLWPKELLSYRMYQRKSGNICLVLLQVPKCPNFLCQTKNLFTYCGSHKHFVPDKKVICIQ